MRKLAILAAAAMVSAGVGYAQTTPSPAASPAVPDPQSFVTPYGGPIGLSRAETAIAGAVAEAIKRGWLMDVAIVDSSGALVAFVRMDGAQLASADIAQHKARASALFRRPTRAFEDAARNGPSGPVMSLDGVIASAGGVPLIDQGKLIGAIGCSGGASAQDEAICLAGAATINGGGN
jgi:uncharacterized protein GlcG (DUF336 family)